jgi:hypothetical protein
MRYAPLAVIVLAGCNQVINEATRPADDARCLAALDHVRQCDARFPDRTALCAYSGSGECAPYINPAQSQCLTQATCEAVRSALDRRDWLCGVPLQALDR